MKIFFFILFFFTGDVFCHSLKKETVLSLNQRLLFLDSRGALESLKKIEKILISSKKERVDESLLRNLFRMLNKKQEKIGLREKASEILLWLKEQDRTRSLYWAFRDFYKNYQDRYFVYKSLRDLGGKPCCLSKVLKWM